MIFVKELFPIHFPETLHFQARFTLVIGKQEHNKDCCHFLVSSFQTKIFDRTFLLLCYYLIFCYFCMHFPRRENCSNQIAQILYMYELSHCGGQRPNNKAFTSCVSLSLPQSLSLSTYFPISLSSFPLSLNCGVRACVCDFQQ